MVESSTIVCVGLCYGVGAEMQNPGSCYQHETGFYGRKCSIPSDYNIVLSGWRNPEYVAKYGGKLGSVVSVYVTRGYVRRTRYRDICGLEAMF